MRVSVNLDPELSGSLMDYADEEDLTLPQAIEEILSDYLLEEEDESEDESPRAKR